MSPEPKAVFLSYASQDAEAVQGIADALRAKGVEVWFDQNELRGGDAWDQKIRRQIRECALFLPIVTANTNARGEGYFRLEWKLAVDRSHLMADDEPFLLPVAIGDFPETAARVPDRFREVQWAWLGTKDTAESIAARAAGLLDDPRAKQPGARRPAAAPRSGRIRAGYVWVAIGIAFSLTFATRPLWHSGPARKLPATVATPAPRSGEATELAERAIAQTRKFNYTRDDLRIAGEYARTATERDPGLARAWGARARVESLWINRYWDAGDARRRSTEEVSRRALALDPDEPDALAAQALVLRAQQALPEAVALLERALKVSPDEGHFRRAIAQTYFMQGRMADGVAMLEEAVRRDPRDALAHYALAMSNAGVARKDPDVDAALAHLDRAISIEPFANAIVYKAALLAAYRGDMEKALATLDGLDSLPVHERAEDRATFFQMWIALLARQPERALAAANRTTSTYFSDSLVAGPIGWMKGFAHRQAGRANAAAEEWRGAERLLRERVKEQPELLLTQAELAITQALLGRKTEAAKQFARYDAAMRDQGRTATPSHLRFHAAMGDRKAFAAALQEARKRGGVYTTEHVIARDPWFDAVR
jgi:tetratricopeptide (TPR) repeat protein